MTKNNTRSGLERAWNILIGDPGKFSAQNRLVNALSIITLVMLLAFYPLILMTGLKDVWLVITILVGIQIFLYYLSRVRRTYEVAVMIYAITSYGALIANYHYNSGISGPTLLLFFMSFHLLLAITPKKVHVAWITLHLVTGIALIWAQYICPSWAPVTYKSNISKFIDYTGTYVISLGFIYVITHYLLNRYDREKRIVEEHSGEIEEQNEKLKEIAWLHSHKVRNHITTIMGLAQLLNEKDATDPVNEKVIKGIVTTSKELDDVIKDINALTEE